MTFRRPEIERMTLVDYRYGYLHPFLSRSLWLHSKGASTVIKHFCDMEESHMGLESLYHVISLPLSPLRVYLRSLLTLSYQKDSHISCPSLHNEKSDLYVESFELWNLITPPWQPRDFITATMRLIGTSPRWKRGNSALRFNEWPQTALSSRLYSVWCAARETRVCILIKKSDCSAMMLRVH